MSAYAFEDTAGQTAIDESGIVESHVYLSLKWQSCTSSEEVFINISGPWGFLFVLFVFVFNYLQNEGSDMYPSGFLD